MISAIAGDEKLNPETICRVWRPNIRELRVFRNIINQIVHFKRIQVIDHNKHERNLCFGRAVVLKSDSKFRRKFRTVKL